MNEVDQYEEEIAKQALKNHWREQPAQAILDLSQAY